MCKEMPVIPVNRVVGMKRIIGKIGGPRRRRGTRGRNPPKIKAPYFCVSFVDVELLKIQVRTEAGHPGGAQVPLGDLVEDQVLGPNRPGEKRSIDFFHFMRTT
jgi:hypothetical protein